MSGYDPIIDDLRKSGLYAPDADDLTVWRETTQHFQTLPPTERMKGINNIDKLYLPDGISCTREAAKALQKRRELEDIHNLLMQAGR